MRSKILPLLAVSTLFACSHSPVKQKTPSFHLGKSWVDVIKTNKPSQRVPARAASVPGLEEFIKAVKAHPEMFNVPVGREVTKKSKFLYEGEFQESVEKDVYLKQNKGGYFSLAVDEDESILEAFDQEDKDSIEKMISSTPGLKGFKKLSSTNFIMKIDSGFMGVCDFHIDVTKSTELFDTSCTTDGELSYESKVSSIKEINLDDYQEQLKSKRIHVYPLVLDCSHAAEDDDSCIGYTISNEEQDWSYLVK